MRRTTRTVADLDRTARALARHFGTDTVVILGSQGILVAWPAAPVLLRTSPEIDAYPANARLWEAERNGEGGPAAEASEEIFALFGEGSAFHAQHGFYIDGVDDRTARLPPSWPARAVHKEIEGHGGARITIVAPCLEDLIVAKLARLAEADRSYIEAAHAARPLDPDVIRARIAEAGFESELQDRAVAYLASLPARIGTGVRHERPPPAHPEGSHCVFAMEGGSASVVRAWNPAIGLYDRIDNPLGPAWVTQAGERMYFMDGRRLTEGAWRGHPRVIAARQGQPTGDARPVWWRGRG